jgi:hypothetical protein
MLTIPRYIQAAGVAIRGARHEWDEWNVRKYFMGVDEGQFERLNKLTIKANTALAIACGEWICFRFQPIDSDPRPLQYLEAGWAAVVDRTYCDFTVTDDDEWRGPVRGPLAMAITIANDAIFGAVEDPLVATKACWMYNLATAVLPPGPAFGAWFEPVVSRLEKFHSAAVDVDTGEEDLFATTDWEGSPVPREAFDPEFDYQPANAPALLDAFLRRLEPDQNPYLHTAKRMRELGWKGEAPYRYAKS